MLISSRHSGKQALVYSVASQSSSSSSTCVLTGEPVQEILKKKKNAANNWRTEYWCYWEILLFESLVGGNWKDLPTKGQSGLNVSSFSFSMKHFTEICQFKGQLALLTSNSVWICCFPISFSGVLIHTSASLSHSAFTWGLNFLKLRDETAGSVSWLKICTASGGDLNSSLTS